MNESHKKQQEIIDYVESIQRNGVSQGTTEWLNRKKNRIGGSSMATIQDDNPYKTMIQMLEGCHSSAPFETSIKMDWGTLFEPMIRMFVEQRKKTKIHGDGMFIEYNDFICYSPDGLGIYTLPCPITGADKVHRALFEFKCPFNRIPAKKVPVYYLPQVRTGLEIIPVADIGIYIEGVFRMCSFEDLNFSKKITKAHGMSYTGTKILAIGMIAFYEHTTDKKYSKLTVENESVDSKESKNQQMRENQQTAYVDIGAQPDELEGFLRKACSGALRVKYSPIINDEKTQTLDVLSSMITEQPVAILCWKLLRCDIHKIDRVENYLERWLPKIEDFCNVSREKDDEKRAQLIEDFKRKYAYSM